MELLFGKLFVIDDLKTIDVKRKIFTPLMTRRAQAAIGRASQAVGVPFGFPFSPIVSATVFIPSMVSAIS